jgi:hypothetical protein
MTAYRVAPDVRWVVERTTLRLVAAAGLPSTLHYPEAAVWDLVSRGYDIAAASRILAPVAGLDERQAEALVRVTVDRWVRAGMLVETCEA